MRAAILPLCAACLLPAQAAPSPAEEIRLLGTESFEERAGAAGRLKALLADLERKGDRAGLREAALALQEARESPDVEIRTAAARLLAPYEAGGAVWMRDSRELRAMHRIESSPSHPDLIACWCSALGERGRGIAVLRAATGEPLWRKEQAEVPGLIHGLILDRDAVLCGGELAERPEGAGWLAAYDARGGNALWSRSGKGLPGPVAALEERSGGIFAWGRTPGGFWMGLFGKEDGAPRWIADGSGFPDPRLLWTRDGILARRNGRLRLYDAETGALRWSLEDAGLPLEYQLSILPDAAVIGGWRETDPETGKPDPRSFWLAAVDLSTGKLRWRRRMKSALYAVGSLPDGIAVLGAGEKVRWVALLDPATGEARWETPLGPEAWASFDGGIRVAEPSGQGEGRKRILRLDPATGKALEAGASAPASTGPPGGWSPVPGCEGLLRLQEGSAWEPGSGRLRVIRERDARPLGDLRGMPGEIMGCRAFPEGMLVWGKGCSNVKDDGVSKSGDSFGWAGLFRLRDAWDEGPWPPK